MPLQQVLCILTENQLSRVPKSCRTRHADIYGPSEALIGRYLANAPSPSAVQVLTKFCCFGRDLDFADSKKFVARVRHAPAALPS
jgi:hypothetical protein